MSFLINPFVYATGGGGGGPTQWNPSDKSTNATITGGGLTVGASSGGNNGARSIKSVSSGKPYFEITINHTAGTPYSGIAKGGVGCDLIIANPGSGGVVVLWFNGNIYINSASPSGSNIGAFVDTDVLCVAFNLNVSPARVFFRRNGGNWNGSGVADPATNTGGLDISSLFPSNAAFAFTGTTNATDSSTANFGATSFAFTMPSGFVSFDSA